MSMQIDNLMRFALSFCLSSLCPLCLCGQYFCMATFFRDALLVQLDPPRVEAGNLRVADGKIVGVGADVAAAAGRRDRRLWRRGA